MATITKIRNGSRRKSNAHLNLTGGAKVVHRTRRRRTNKSSASHRSNPRRTNYTRRRRSNPRRRVMNRRRNPSLAGIGGKVIFAAIGILGVKFLAPLIPLGNNSPWANIGKELLVGYGLAYIGERMLKLSPDKVDGLMIGGMSVGAVDTINVLLPQLNATGLIPLQPQVTPQQIAAAAGQGQMGGLYRRNRMGMLVRGPGVGRMPIYA